jgi:ketosteroid isomerase-like protein
MSQANVDLVRTIYERFRAGDNDGALELFDPAVEVHDRPQAPDPQVFHGREGVVSSLGVSQATFEGLDIVPEEFVDAGDQVLVAFRFVGSGRESGVPVDERLAHAWTIRDGKAVRMTVHSSLDEAVQAVRRPPARKDRGAAAGSGGAGERY